jgi:hypothetical protein
MNSLSPLKWCLLFLSCCCGGAAEGLHHYVFFNRERERVSDSLFIETKALEGAQLKYAWRELEPEKGAYDSSAVARDLGFLKEKGKRLFIQLQDSSDGVEARVSEFGGLAARQPGTIANSQALLGIGPGAGWSTVAASAAEA